MRSRSVGLALAGLALTFTLGAPVAGAVQQTVTVEASALLPDGSAAAGVPLSLQVHDGTRFVHEEALLADGDGHARFEGVPVGPGHAARLGAIHEGSTYWSETLALEDAGGRPTLAVRIAPVSSAGRPIHLDTLHLIIQAESPTAFRVLQFVTVSNAGETAWAGGPALPDGRPAGLEVPLPSAARQVTAAPFPTAAEALPVDDLDPGATRLLDPRPVPPGGRQAAVTYVLDASDGPARVELRLPYPTQAVSVLLGGAAAGAVTLDDTRLDERPPQEIGGESYRMWGAEALPPGDVVRFRIGPPSGPLLPPYGWALAGLGLSLLLAMGATYLAPASTHDRRRQQEILTAIARLDLAHDRGDVDTSDYHRARGRELERLFLLEQRLGTARTAASGEGD